VKELERELSPVFFKSGRELLFYIVIGEEEEDAEIGVK